MKNTIRLMNYEIYTGDLLQIDTSKKMVITTINQYSFCLAEENEELKNALLQSDLLLPEGLSIVFAIRILLGKKIKKITQLQEEHLQVKIRFFGLPL
jgi:N-acetylglucosaminyldiphosphoundecaprenol N-acetyl-beta-D-mannosaminyltransferase